MVANAGVVGWGSITEATVEDWDRGMRVNARGPFLQYKVAAEQMVKQGRGGRIIGASSMAGTKGFKGLGAYCVSKWAIRGLTQSVAADLIPHKITVNAYAPGFIKSKMSISEADAGRGPGAAAKLAMGFPADGPIGELEDIASIVSYLAKPEAYFITGQTILVDGGIL